MGRKLKLGMRKKPLVKRETDKEEAPVAAVPEPAEECASPPRACRSDGSRIPVMPSPVKLMTIEAKMQGQDAAGELRAAERNLMQVFRKVRVAKRVYEAKKAKLAAV